MSIPINEKEDDVDPPVEISYEVVYDHLLQALDNAIITGDWGVVELLSKAFRDIAE